MHPNVKKYSEFVKHQEKFNGECKAFENDLKLFTNHVEQFQKTIDDWIKTNAEIIKHLPAHDTAPAFHLIELMKKATELSNAMTHLYTMESDYSKYVTDYNKQLLSMSKLPTAELIIASLPKLKSFNKKKNLSIREKISALKMERTGVEKLFAELQFMYKQVLN